MTEPDYAEHVQPDSVEPWQLPLDVWLSAPRCWTRAARRMTLDEWRARHGYSNVLGDHGDFSHPHGISKATRRRIQARFNERSASMLAGAAAYEAALKEGRVPMVTPVVQIKADGYDPDHALAAARVHHRTSVRRARLAGLPVPLAVLDAYGLASRSPARNAGTGPACPAAGALPTAPTVKG